MRGCFAKKRDTNGPSTKSLVIKSVILFLLGIWFYQVISLIQEDTESATEFDPYRILGIPTSTGFNSAEVKKAYRRLAKQYHPDKIKEEDKESS